MSAPALLVSRVRAHRQLPRRSPLDYWHFAVPRVRKAFGLFMGPEPIHELHLRGPNKGTKTQTCAAYVTACLQKRKHLDGVPLPQWDGKVSAAQLMLDFQQQVLSVQEAYERVIGDWPHHVHRSGIHLSGISVMPVGGDPNDQKNWSFVHFLSQKNPDTGVGVRADIVAFDEPPKMPVLRELRKAPHAGRRGLRIIGETPTKRSQWAELAHDYGDTPRATLRRVDRLRAEVRWNMDEVAEWCMSAQEKRDLKGAYRGDPLFGEDGGARWHGDYTVTEGACPFDVVTLVRMMGECRDPEEVTWRIPVEDSEGKPRLVSTATLHVWEKPRAGKSYYIPIDTASGVADKAHDPLAFHVVEHGSGDIVALFEDRISPYSVGMLAAGVARQYNNAVVDFEVNDGWGVGVFAGLSDSHYGNTASQVRSLQPGSWSKELGWRTNATTRGEMITAVQAWIDAYRAGASYGRCWSRRVFEELLDCIIDDKGKILAGPMSNDEHLILRGQGLRKAVTRSGRAIPEIQAPVKTKDEKWAAMIAGNGDRVDDEGPMDYEGLVPKRRR